MLLKVLSLLWKILKKIFTLEIMTLMTIRQSIQKGLREALNNDPSVFLMGEDIGEYGGAYAITSGFLEEFGSDRIKDTPISEATFIGAGIGAATVGLKPIVELMSMSFSLVAFDQIVNMAANLRYMSGGQISVPLIIRAPTGAGMQLGATHSQSFETWLSEVPGLKVITFSSPSDALGLLRSAVKDSNPIIIAEPAGLYGVRGDVSDEYYEIPIGSASVVKEGNDVTLVSYGHGIPILLDTREELIKINIDAEIIDLRTLNPLDMVSIDKSIEKTGRVVLLDTSRKLGGIMPEIVSRIQENSVDFLDGPIVSVGSENTPWPYNKNLENYSLPNVDNVIESFREAYKI